MTDTPAPVATQVDGAGDPPRRRILMSAGARTIEVEGPDDLDALTYLAVMMWSLAGDPAEPKLAAGGMGFAADLAAPPAPTEPGEPDDDQDRPVMP